MGSVGKSTSVTSMGYGFAPKQTSDSKLNKLIRATDAKISDAYQKCMAVLKNQYAKSPERTEAVKDFIQVFRDNSSIQDNSTSQTFYIADNGMVWSTNKNGTSLYILDNENHTRGLSPDRTAFTDWGRADDDLIKISNSLYDRWRTAKG